MLEVIILAAGKGTRMLSDMPKVLHQLGGKPLLGHVLETCRQLDAARIHVVYGFAGESLRAYYPDGDLNWVEQAEQQGTGHAVSLALEHVSAGSTVLILYGDVPLVSSESLRAMLQAASTVSRIASRLKSAVEADPLCLPK